MDTRAERIELAAAILLAVATVLTAWSAFEATKWSGVMSVRFSEANAARTESVQASTAGGQLATIDVDLFTDWLSAVSTEQAELQAFLEERFRDEFKPAFEAWLDADPLNNPDAPQTPFDTPEYALSELEESEQLAAKADRKSEQARDANQRGDNYVLTTVLFAAVLFFAGVSTKFVRNGTKILALGFAALLLIAGVGLLLTFPVEI